MVSPHAIWAILVHQATETVPAQNAHTGHVTGWMCAVSGRVLLQRPVRPVSARRSVSLVSGLLPGVTSIVSHWPVRCTAASKPTRSSDDFPLPEGPEHSQEPSRRQLFQQVRGKRAAAEEKAAVLLGVAGQPEIKERDVRTPPALRADVRQRSASVPPTRRRRHAHRT